MRTITRCNATVHVKNERAVVGGDIFLKISFKNDQFACGDKHIVPTALPPLPLVGALCPTPFILLEGVEISTNAQPSLDCPR
jgi:hypothetical protein